MTLLYRGTVKWSTACKGLIKLGFRVRYVDGPEQSSDVFDMALRPASLYTVRLLGPIPVPEVHEGETDTAGDEPCITFGRK